MGTFLSIQQRVTRRVIDLPSAVTAEVPTLVNEAIVDLQRDHNYKVMEADFSGTTTAGSNILGAIPTGFKEYRGRPYLTTFTGTEKKLNTIGKIQDLFPDIMLTTTGEPQVVLMYTANFVSANFLVYPIPDGNSDYVSGEYSVVVPYWAYTPALVGNSDTNWFTENAERFIVEWATSQAFGLDWDTEHEAFALQKAETERAKVKLQDKRFRLAGVDTLAFHRDMNSSRLRV